MKGQDILLLAIVFFVVCYMFKGMCGGVEKYNGKEVTASVIAGVYDDIVKEDPDLATRINVLPSPSDVMRRIRKFESTVKREITDPVNVIKKFIFKMNSINIKTPSVMELSKK